MANTEVQRNILLPYNIKSSGTKDTIRQGLERFMVHGYSVDDSYRYVVKNKIGTVYGTWLYRCPGTE